MTTSCHAARESLSCDLDGEHPAGDFAAAHTHLDECADCRRWYADAAAVNRRLRIGAAPSPAAAAEPPGQDLAGRVLSLIDLRTVCGCGDTCQCSDPCGCGDLCACRH